MIKKISVFILGFLLVFSPFIIFAGYKEVGTCSGNTKVEFSGLVPICNTTIDVKGNICDPCNFNMLLALVNNLISFVLFTLATPLFALILIYAGWLYLSDQGSAENKNKAKKVLKNAFIGYIIALAAWLIVKGILWAVDYQGTSYLS